MPWTGQLLPPALSRPDLVPLHLDQSDLGLGQDPVGCTMEKVGLQRGCLGDASYQAKPIDGGTWTAEQGGQYRLVNQNLQQSFVICLASENITVTTFGSQISMRRMVGAVALCQSAPCTMRATG